MRRFIRHPSDIPMQYNLGKEVEYTKEYLKNIGHGGLSFNSKVHIKPGTKITIKIQIHNPGITAKGIVKRCCKLNDGYEIGVSFADEQTEFAIRMVEQVCYIEHYKREVLKNEGRIISGKIAAIEWVNKNAANFPR
ncbi:MAG: PilZ domain-containing protein [Candidatus Tenebribacter davisii]|jgi:hypothetical protein|nr:PilZ domain-containing protein [Candidatus Tenebribacter davisii]